MAGSKSRVAIIGAAGVGKTTLLNELFKDKGINQSYSKIDEVVRVLCAERGYSSPYDIPELEIHQFRIDVLNKQIALENEANSFIVDRSTIDAWAYFMRWSWNSVTVELTEEFYQAAYKQAQHYDLLVYLPRSIPLMDDGYRWNNIVYQEQIDRLLKSIIKDWELESKFCEIKSKDLKVRTNELKEKLLLS